MNFDDPEHRLIITKKQWLRNVPLVILDELHKLTNWKRFLKAIYDVNGLSPKILLTGSARIDTFKKAGDSLAGRYLGFRLHPFCLKELKGQMERQEIFSRLMNHGGFPEPFLANDSQVAARWRRSHLDTIIRQDLIDLEQVRQIQNIETLVELLKNKVGTPISYTSLAEDLQTNIHSIKRWLTILEHLYVIFKLPPWNKNIARAVQKTPKYYFFDTGQLPDDLGARFENNIALAIRKELNQREDLLGEKWTMSYMRNRDGLEIDFFIVGPKNQALMIEAKWKDSDPHKRFLTLAKDLRFKDIQAIQLVGELANEKQITKNYTIRDAATWLEDMPLS